MGHDSCWIREAPRAIPGNSSQLLLMSIAIVTGSAGLIGSETSKKFHGENFTAVRVIPTFVSVIIPTYNRARYVLQFWGGLEVP